MLKKELKMICKNKDLLYLKLSTLMQTSSKISLLRVYSSQLRYISFLHKEARVRRFFFFYIWTFKSQSSHFVCPVYKSSVSTSSVKPPLSRQKM